MNQAQSKFGKYTVRAILAAMLLSFGIGFAPGELPARSVAEKARDKRNELITYLRTIRPMVYNFPCDPMPKCISDAQAAGRDTTRVRMYKDIKRVYQQGLIYFFERNFINSYLRFLDAQRRTEELMEDLSQSYLDRTELMMRDSIEQKDYSYIKDPKKRTEKERNDKALVDISIEFGPNSKLRQDFSYKREAPNETRRYTPAQVHYARNKYRIEKNMEKGYYHLGIARKARQKALTVDKYLAAHQKLTPAHRKKRIEFYIKTVQLARLSKLNAEFIYRLKYPYDNYAMDGIPNKEIDQLTDASTVPEIEKTKMNWLKNPYYLPKKLHPVFDQRLPARYRRDATDVRNWTYKDEVDMNIKFKFYKKPPTKSQPGS